MPDQDFSWAGIEKISPVFIITSMDFDLFYRFLFSLFVKSYLAITSPKKNKITE